MEPETTEVGGCSRGPRTRSQAHARNSHERSLWPLLRLTTALGAVMAVTGLIWVLYENWQTFQEWKTHTGFWPFFIALTLLPLIGIPSTPFFLLAGAGSPLQTALVGFGAATAANLALSHWIARHGIRDRLYRLLRRWSFNPPSINGEGAVSVLLVVRLTPGLPPALRNYAAALIDVRFFVYLSVSWITTMLYGVGLIVLGDSLRTSSWAEAAVGLDVLLTVTAGALWFVRWKERERRSEPLRDASKTGQVVLMVVVVVIGEARPLWHERIDSMLAKLRRGC